MSVVRTKTMKWLAGLTTSALLLGAGASAAMAGSTSNTSGHPNEGDLMRGMKVERRVAKMERELGLSAAQTERVRSILEARHEAMRAAHERSHAEMEEVLSPEQLDALDTMIAQDRERRGPPGGPRGRGKGRLEKMVQELGLDEAQKAEFERIQEESRAERKAILDAAGGDREAARAELKALREATRLKFEAVLDDEQKARFEQMREKMNERRKQRRDQRESE